MIPSLIPRGVFATVAVALAALAVAPAAAQAANVAFFTNGTYVDNANPGGEATNLNASLVAAGHTVRSFTGITATDFSTALSGQDALVIPEQERPGSLQADLAADAKQELRDFVSAGGNFVTFAQHKAVLDTVFGFSIGTTGPIVMGGDAVKVAGAAATPYAGGPATLAPNSAVYGMAVSALPANARVAYVRTEGSIDYAVVVLIPYGAGTITYFGWDWYNSNPPFGGGKDGGWQSMLSLATAANVPPDLSADDVTVPEGAAGTTTASVPVSLSTPATATVTASYATADGTAVAGEDYTASSGTVTFGLGEQHKTVDVAVTPDAAVEPVEAFSLTLSSPSGAALVHPTAAVTITNDDVSAPAPDPVTPAPATPAPEATTTPVTPAPQACKSRRIVRTHVQARHGARLRATIAGTSIPVRDAEVLVDLTDRPAGSYRIVVRNARGRVLTTRVLRTCVVS